MTRIILELDADGTLRLCQDTGTGVQLHIKPPPRSGPEWGQVLPSGVRAVVAKISPYVQGTDTWAAIRPASE